MFPIINIFGKEIGTYAIMALIGGLLAGYYSCQLIKNKKLDVNDFIVFLLICVIGIFIGGHILFGITNFDKFIFLVTHLNRVKSVGHLFNCLAEIFGGSVFYGGLIGGIVTGLIYLKIKKINLKEEYSDALAPAAPLFHTFGRIGCFLGGCCYGIESKFGILYDNTYYFKDLEVVRRFPVQLVEAGCNFILFIVLNYLYKKNRFKGNLLLIYLMSYSVIRFILEFFRGDEYRGFLFNLSTSQLISIGLFIISIILFIRNRETKKMAS